MANAVPDVQITHTARPVALAMPKAKKAAPRSSISRYRLKADPNRTCASWATIEKRSGARAGAYHHIAHTRAHQFVEERTHVGAQRTLLLRDELGRIGCLSPSPTGASPVSPRSASPSPLSASASFSTMAYSSPSSPGASNALKMVFSFRSISLNSAAASLPSTMPHPA